jgi:hypothetical protein
MVRLQCPKCHRENTWAQYVHTPCQGAANGTTKWEEPANGTTPDGTPVPRPCPNDGPTCQASGVNCRDCGNVW